MEHITFIPHPAYPAEEFAQRFIFRKATLEQVDVAALAPEVFEELAKEEAEAVRRDMKSQDVAP